MTGEIVVKEVLALWSAAFSRMDSSALADLYDEEAIFYGSTPNLFRGREGVLDYFRALFPLSEAKASFETVAVVGVGEGTIAAAALVWFVLGPRAPMRFRITWTLVETPRGWRILSHHASPLAVAGPESGGGRAAD